jgi:hypothetical protein
MARTSVSWGIFSALVMRTLVVSLFPGLFSGIWYFFLIA